LRLALIQIFLNRESCVAGRYVGRRDGVNVASPADVFAPASGAASRRKVKPTFLPQSTQRETAENFSDSWHLLRHCVISPVLPSAWSFSASTLLSPAKIKRARRCDGPLNSRSCRQELRSQPSLPASCRPARGGERGVCSPPRPPLPRYQAARLCFEIGRSRMRLPVAAKIALVNAGVNGGTPGSPTPPGGNLPAALTRCT
jgi:hypothetical protein